MQDHLLQHHHGDLESLGMESCDNFGHVVECTLQECIVQPLSHFIYLRIEEYYATNGHLFQLQRSIHQGKLKSPDDLGIRVSLAGLGGGFMCVCKFPDILRPFVDVFSWETLGESSR